MAQVQEVMWEINYHDEPIMSKESRNIRKLKDYLAVQSVNRNGIKFELCILNEEEFTISGEANGIRATKMFSRKMLRDYNIEDSNIYIYITAIAEIKKTIREHNMTVEELEARVKKLEDVVFDQWLSQYGYGKPNIPTNYHLECDFEHNYSWKPDDIPPYVPTHAASQEDVERAMKEYENYCKINDYLETK